ncbi:MAG: hypothetical protein Q3962_06520 [Corynebacterium sp.]|nr:hypothetical protein [Corynebacterium sp.]
MSTLKHSLFETKRPLLGNLAPSLLVPTWVYVVFMACVLAAINIAFWHRQGFPLWAFFPTAAVFTVAMGLMTPYIAPNGTPDANSTKRALTIGSIGLLIIIALFAWIWMF